MEPKRYWWIQYRVNGGHNHMSYDENTGIKEMCIEIHPFQLIHNMKEIEKRVTSRYTYDYELINWKLIDIREYDLFNNLNSTQ